MTLRERDALPAEYEKLDFKGRLDYLATVRTEVLELNSLVQTMREKAPQNPLISTTREMTIRVPPLPRLKPRVSRNAKYHHAKIFNMRTLGQGSAAHPSVVTVAQDCMAVFFDVETGLKYEAFPVSRGHTASVAVNKSGRVTTTGGLACTIDVYATTKTVNNLLGDPIKPFPFDLQDETLSMFRTGDLNLDPNSDSATIVSSVDGFGGVTGRFPGSPRDSVNQDIKPPTGWSSEGIEQFVTTLSGGHESCVVSQVFATEATLLSASEESIMLWDITYGKSISQFSSGLSGCTCIDTSPIDKTNGVIGPQLFASSASDATTQLWDVREENSVMQFSGPAERGGFDQVVIMPDGLTMMASDAYGMTLFDTRTNGVLQTYDAAREVPTTFCVTSSGRLVLTGHEDGTITVMDTLRGEYISLMVGHKGKITGVSTVGNQVVSSSFDGTVKLWSLEALTKTQPKYV